MKKLKLYPIVAGIACFTCSIKIHGMDAPTIKNLLSKTADTCTGLASDLITGISNHALGYAGPLMGEIESGKVSLDETKRSHRYEHAIDELIKYDQPEKLLELIERVNKHNTSYPSLTFLMSAQHHAKIQMPLQQLYATKRKQLITVATKQADELKRQWDIEYEEIVADLNLKMTNMSEMSRIIAAAGGQKPDDQSITRELETLLAIQKKYTFAATIASLIQQQQKALAEKMKNASASSATNTDNNALNGTQATDQKNQPQSGSSASSSNPNNDVANTTAATDKSTSAQSASAANGSSSSTSTITAAALTKLVEQQADKKANPSSASAASGSSSSSTTTPTNNSQSAPQAQATQARNSTTPPLLNLDDDSKDDDHADDANNDDTKDTLHTVSSTESLTSLNANSCATSNDAESKNNKKKKKK